MEFGFPSTHPHELVLFFYPSPGLNWTNPRSLTFTTTRNKLLGRPRGIGHVSILLRSPGRFELTGMTQLHGNEGRKEVLFGGYGLGILLHNFVGALEDSEKLAPELVKRSRDPGKLSYLRVSVNEPIADRLFGYLSEFRAKLYDLWYGMRNRPLYGEGSGCSAFGASFLETAGLLREEFRKEWTRTFKIHSDLVGGPITGKRVSVLELLRRADRWALDEEPHETGFFWDPDLMHSWTVRTHEKETRSPSGSYSPEEWNSATGLSIDSREAVPPSGPVFRRD